MRHILLLLGLVFPLASYANSSFNIQEIACSGNLSSSSDDGVSFLCAGNLSLNDGSILSSKNVTIQADRDLQLDDLDIHAFAITLTANSIFMGANLSARVSEVWTGVNNVSPNTHSVLVTPGGISLSTGGEFGVNNTQTSQPYPYSAAGGSLLLHSGDIVLTNAGGSRGAPKFTLNPSISPVPEPNSAAMILCGLIALGFTGMRRKPQ